jgi:ADP-ribose pyrophosphatase
MTGGARELVAEGAHLRLVRRRGWEYAERVVGSGVAVIVAITDDGRLLLAEQYREPVGRPVIELPAGLVGDRPDDPQEGLMAAARRELLEETGFDAGELSYLAEGPPSAGLAAEIVTFMLACRLTKVGPGGGDPSEEIRVHEVALPEVAAWLRERAAAGTLIDPKVYAGLFLAEQARVRPPRA